MPSLKDAREPLRGRIPRGSETRDEAGARLCRWCLAPVPKRRRTFCSKACVHEHRLRSNTNYLRAFVLARDQGVCAACGRDCLALATEAHSRDAAQGREVTIAWLTGLGYNRFRIQQCLDRSVALWDAAHRTPVNWGGGGCDLNGMKTLCCPCHKSETKIQRNVEALGFRDGEQTTLWGTTLLDEISSEKHQEKRW